MPDADKELYEQLSRRLRYRIVSEAPRGAFAPGIYDWLGSMPANHTDAPNHALLGYLAQALNRRFPRPMDATKTVQLGEYIDSLFDHAPYALAARVNLLPNEDKHVYITKWTSTRLIEQNGYIDDDVRAAMREWLGMTIGYQGDDKDTPPDLLGWMTAGLMHPTMAGSVPFQQLGQMIKAREQALRSTETRAGQTRNGTLSTGTSNALRSRLSYLLITNHPHVALPQDIADWIGSSYGEHSIEPTYRVIGYLSARISHRRGRLVPDARLEALGECIVEASSLPLRGVLADLQPGGMANSKRLLHYWTWDRLARATEFAPAVGLPERWLGLPAPSEAREAADDLLDDTLDGDGVINDRDVPPELLGWMGAGLIDPDGPQLVPEDEPPLDNYHLELGYAMYRFIDNVRAGRHPKDDG